MQLTSQDNTKVIDYYPTKNAYGYPIDNQILKVITYNGQTIVKTVMDSKYLDNEITNRLWNHNYKVTMNTKRPAQFITQEAV